MKKTEFYYPETRTADRGLLRTSDRVDSARATVLALISIKDWDVLFLAVKARLMQTVGEKLAATPVAKDDEAASLVQGIVLECVAALHHPHTALTHERGLRDQLEQEVFEAQAALARALADSSLRQQQQSTAPAQV